MGARQAAKVVTMLLQFAEKNPGMTRVMVGDALVFENERLQQRMNQYALAHVSRLGSMGELAAAIAHEINQPLSAARTYTGLVAESLQTETLRDPSTLEMAGKAAGIELGPV